MKKTVILIILVMVLTLPLFAINYSGGVKAAMGGVMMKNTSLSYEDNLREAVRVSVTLMPASFIVGNFDLGIYASLICQGSTSVSGYTRILGYRGLSAGFSSAYLLSESLSIGLSLGAGYSVTDTVNTGSAFLESALSLSCRITGNFSASLETGLMYRSTRLEIPVSFALSVKPFAKRRPQ